ncbi:DUF2147 domain-containing protein [Thermomonas brevis]
MRKIILTAGAGLLAMLAAGVSAQSASSATGRWKTIDDETGKVKSIVEITQTASGELQGKVVDILHSDKGPNPVCDKCSGANKNKPVKGMTILWGLKPDGAGKWAGGQILDPAKGKTYKSKLTLTDGGNKLQMRGFMGIEALGRTQVWVRE